MTRGRKKKDPEKHSSVAGITGLLRELWQAAVTLRAAVIPHEACIRAYEEKAMPLLDRMLLGIEESMTLAATREVLLPKLLSPKFG